MLVAMETQNKEKIEVPVHLGDAIIVLVIFIAHDL